MKLLRLSVSIKFTTSDLLVPLFAGAARFYELLLFNNFNVLSKVIKSSA